MKLGGGAAFQRRLPVALVCCIALTLAGCGSSSQHANTTTTVTETSTTISAADATILQRYREWWSAYVAAGDPINPEDPRLAELATGKELATVRKSFLGLKIDGDVLKGTIDTSPTLVSKTDTTATIRDCSTDRGHVYKVATGKEVGTSSETNELLSVTMTLENGEWKVSSIDHQGSGCVVGSH